MEAYFSDRGGGSDDRYSIIMDLPVVAHSRPRVVPTAFKRLTVPGKAPGTQVRAKDAAMERQLPDVCGFAKALVRIRANLANYDRAKQEDGKTKGTGAANAGRVDTRAARLTFTERVPIDPTHQVLARACFSAAITLSYEDADASYRPSPAI
jgi:hypothetical protein